MSKVILVGCGIAAPVLALLLKQRGYQPVIYERREQDADGGLSVLLQLNGLRILSLIPGIIEQLPGRVVEEAANLSIVPTNEGVLCRSSFPAMVRKKYGFGMMGVHRPRFLALLASTAAAHGIPIHYNMSVVHVTQSDQCATVHFDNGQSDSASFVVGCDGLHSVVRTALFGRDAPAFTGLTQMGGFIPMAFPDQKPTIFNFFGDGLHVISYPASETGYIWGITQREAEMKETWRVMNSACQDSIRSGPFSRLPFGIGKLIQASERITKFGLYDRPELNSWHKNRVILIGDAAHPTSPHLGQGANQALEDAFHLVRILVQNHPDPNSNPSTATLRAIYKEFEAKRIPRTATLVQEARKAGELRVVQGVEAALARNDFLRSQWSDEQALLRSKVDMLSEQWEDCWN